MRNIVIYESLSLVLVYCGVQTTVRLWREELDWGLRCQSFATVDMPNIALYTNPHKVLDGARCPSYITLTLQFHRRSTMTNAKVYQIPLSQNKVALVSPEDYHFLIQHKWCAQAAKHNHYAVRTAPNPDTKSKYKSIKMHRVILARMVGCDLLKTEHCDHINGNGLDNRRENLRICTHAENQRNSRSRGGSSSQYKGVYWRRDTEKWHSAIWMDGKPHYLGIFTSEIEAAKAYDAVALKHFGRFAKPNFPISKHLALAELPDAEFDAMLAQERHV
tara:strand:+ start:944 stop:1768 length:825 start_codon:yes stop_codon:yes gene_type:complete